MAHGCFVLGHKVLDKHCGMSGCIVMVANQFPFCLFSGYFNINAITHLCNSVDWWHGLGRWINYA